MTFFNDYYYKTNYGYARKNFDGTAFILEKDLKINEDDYYIKKVPYFDNILSGKNLEDVLTFETSLDEFKVAIELVGTEVELFEEDIKYLWNIYFVSAKDGCFLSSEKYDDLTSCYPIKFVGKGEEIKRIYFSPKLLLNCLEDVKEETDEKILIEVKQYDNKDDMYIMKITFENLDMYICGMSGGEDDARK